MSVGSASELEGLLKKCGHAWLIELFAPDGIAFLLELLAQTDAESTKRFGSSGPRFTQQALAREYEIDPYRIGAFLQALAPSRSPQMLLMAWRIIKKDKVIRSVELSYQDRKSFFLKVVLGSLGDANGQEEIYESSDIDDATLLGHFGTAHLNNLPLFLGFYPAKWD